MAKRVRPYRVALAVCYPSSYEDEIVRGAIDFSQHTGGRWQFESDDERPFLPFEQIDLEAVDGVIGSFFSVEWAEAVGAARVAAVNTSTRYADIPLPRVGNDDEAIGRVGGQHLLERGFPHFGFVGVGTAWYAQRRLDGFRQVIERESGRSCDALALPSSHADEHAAMLLAWLARLPKPLAVMAADDRRGLGTLNAAAKLGLRIPEDVAVLGVDNDYWTMALAPAPMSSVALDARRIGYRAAELLDRLMHRGKAPPSPQWIPPIGVVIRQSTDYVVQEDAVVVQALRFIRDHCDEAIKVDDVLHAVGMSRTAFETRLKKALGLTPQSVIFRVRIERAKKLLMESNHTVGWVAERCGFEWQEQFNRVFKRLTGLTPGQYRGQRRTAGP